MKPLSQKESGIFWRPQRIVSGGQTGVDRAFEVESLVVDAAPAVPEVARTMAAAAAATPPKRRTVVELGMHLRIIVRIAGSRARYERRSPAKGASRGARRSLMRSTRMSRKEK